MADHLPELLAQQSNAEFEQYLANFIDAASGEPLFGAAPSPATAAAAPTTPADGAYSDLAMLQPRLAMGAAAPDSLLRPLPVPTRHADAVVVGAAASAAQPLPAPHQRVTRSAHHHQHHHHAAHVPVAAASTSSDDDDDDADADGGAESDDAASASLAPADEEAIRACTQLPHSAFNPVRRVHEAVALATSRGASLALLRQPAGEVTRAVYIDLHLRFVLHGRAQCKFKPSVALLYEDDRFVEPVTGHEVCEALYAFKDDVCALKVRINELSKSHRNARFRVRVAVELDGAVASVCTLPMRVLSKTSIVRQHQRAMADDGASVMDAAGAGADEYDRAASPLAADASVLGKRGASVALDADGSGQVLVARASLDALVAEVADLRASAKRQELMLTQLLQQLGGRAAAAAASSSPSS